MTKWGWVKVAIGALFWLLFVYLTVKYNMDDCVFLCEIWGCICDG